MSLVSVLQFSVVFLHVQFEQLYGTREKCAAKISTRTQFVFVF